MKARTSFRANAVAMVVIGVALIVLGFTLRSMLPMGGDGVVIGPIIGGVIMLAVAGFMWWFSDAFGDLRRPTLRQSVKQANVHMAQAQQLMGAMTANMGGAGTSGLRTSGRPVTLHVQAVTDTGTRVNFDPVVEVQLLVTPADGTPPHPTTKRLLVSTVELGRLHQGAVLNGWEDPARPGVVELDLQATSV